MEFVTAEGGPQHEAAASGEVEAERDAAARGAGVDGSGAPRSAEAVARSGGGSATDASARVHSVRFVLPADMQGMLDFILPEIMPGIVEMCRRHREFATSWPGGPGEMEMALRQSVEESGRGPLLHGMRLPQAEKLREQLSEFVEVEVVVDREAAARVQERERRSRPPPRPPPAALLARFLPGARVRVAAQSEAAERLQQGFGEWSEEVRRALGSEGTVTAYRPVEAQGSWAVRVTSELEGGARCQHHWNPGNLGPAVAATQASQSSGVAACAAAEASEAPAKPREVLLVNDEDLLEGDSVLFHSDGCWHAGRIASPGESDAFHIDAADGRREENVPRRQIHMVTVLECLPEPIREGSVVRITGDVDMARQLQRSRWTEGMRSCLGQLGMVMEAQDRRRMAISCPAAAGPTVWHVCCLRPDKSEGLRCLDLHEHPLWWCASLEPARTCARCSEAGLRQAFCCFRSGECAVCARCAAAYQDASTWAAVRSRHHLCPLSWVALPRGPQHSRWSCGGTLMPGGCRSAAGGAARVSTRAMCCAACEFLLCEACLRDDTLGEASAQTRRTDVDDLPSSAPRITATLRAHPSEIFGLGEAGLFPRLAACLCGEPAACKLAHDLITWLVAAAPVRSQAGPALVDAGGGTWLETNVISEDCDSLDGTWTDENEPGRWMRTIEDGKIYPPEELGAEAAVGHGANHMVEVSACGMPEFNGRYAPDGIKNGKTKYRKADGGVQTCNYSSGAWYLCHNHAGSWYQSSSDADLPPSAGWTVGGRGQPPAPVVVCVGQAKHLELARPAPARSFVQQPSVGTWLRPRLLETEAAALSDVAGRAVCELDGIWRREASGEHITIAGATLTWPDGDSTQISLAGTDAFSMEFQGQVYNANLQDSGLRLVWSDGDVWIRAFEPAEPRQRVPEEGQPVNYKGFSGCTIKEIISQQRVLIHIPGVGDEEAAIGEYSPQDAGPPGGSDAKAGSEITKVARLERLGKDAFSMEFADAVRCAQITSDGRIVWADGGSSWVRMEQCPRCPKAHILRRTRHTAPWKCDDCEERWTERRRLRCGACDYDICESCLALRNWERRPCSVTEATFAPGAEAELRVAGAGPRSCEWLRCRVDGAGDTEGTFNVSLLSAGEAQGAASGPNRELRSIAPGRLRRRGLTAAPGPVDALWRYASPNDVAIGIRSVPEIEGPRDGQLQHGHVFRVSEHREGADGVLFLRLADGRGWVFDRKPGVGTMCVLLRACHAAVDGKEAAASCTVAWSDSAAESADGEAGRPRTCRVSLERLRPPFSAAGPRDCGCNFLRAELLRELRRGSQCARRRVQGLLQGRANVLGVEGGEDVLSVALQRGCSADVVEVLLAANAPIIGPHAPTLAVPSWSSTDARDAISTSEAHLSVLMDPLRMTLALGEPRIAALVAERGGRLAMAAAEAMEELAESIGEQPSAMSSGKKTGSACAARAAGSVVGEGCLADERAKVEGDAHSTEAVSPLEAAAIREAARTCALASRRLASSMHPRGCLSELLRQLGRELIGPLLKVDKGVALEPASWLGSLLRALGNAGYEPTALQINHLASAIVARLTEDPMDAVHGILSFIRLVLDVFAPGGQGSSSFMQALVAAFQRHGALASIERLADPGTAVRLQRPGADPQVLRSKARDLAERLRVPGQVHEMDSSLAAVVAALPCPDALERLVSMLRQGTCTPYELGLHDAPRRILPMFETDSRVWPWVSPAPVDATSMVLLVSHLQALLGMCESFPMAALNVRGDGLNCLLQPHVLALEGAGCKRELRVEPLLPLSDLERFVLHTTAVADDAYLRWCQELCGQRIADRPLGSEGPWQAALVLAFSLETRLPRHTVRYEADGREVHLLLHLRSVVVLQHCQESSQQEPAAGAEAGPRRPSPSPQLYGAGCKVQARFEDGSWCRATVEQGNDDGTYTISWDNGTQTDTVKQPDEIRAIPGGKPVCQRVRVTQEGGTVAGVAVWEHASGAQDVVDQDGCYLAGVPRGSVVPEAQHARDSPGRPMPFEIRNLSMPERSTPLPVPSLERAFSAVDRNYRPRDFQYKNPARKIGGPEGEPLQPPEPAENSPSLLSLEQEVRCGNPAPRLRVRFFRQLSGEQASGTRPAACQPATEEPTGGEPRSGGPVGEAASATFQAICETAGSKGQAVKPGVQARGELLGGPPAGAQLPKEVTQPLSSSSTVLQALLQFAPGKCASLPERLCLSYKLLVEFEQLAPLPRAPMAAEGLCRSQTGVSRASNVGAVGMAGPVLALLRRLRRHLQSAAEPSTEFRWENGPLNRKLLDQLAQPLLTAAIAAPPWVFELPLAYPFLFERKAREQLLRCAGFGTSHAVLWLQRQSIEERYGDRLRRMEGQLEGRMDLTEHIVSDPQVFIGPARSDFITLPSRDGLLDSAERVIQLTHDSKAMLEVKFADEGGFGDGVTQSFYTAVAAELTAVASEGPMPLCGVFGLWAEHLPTSVIEHQGRKFLHSRHGLFPRPHVPGSPGSELACRHFQFLGRLMAKALRDGFLVPLPLCVHFFSAVLGEDLPLEALPMPGSGCVGELVGATAQFALELRRRHAGLEGSARALAYQEEAQKPAWARRFLRCEAGETASWSFNQYVQACGMSFCESGVGGQELCEGGNERPVEVATLEEFVESAAWWWLRDGITPQVAAFRRGVADVCETSAIWAFEAAELSALLCGSSVEWSREELQQHLRPRGGIEARDMEMLVNALDRMTLERREDFLEFVTACPRLPPGGLAAAEITVAPAQPPGSLPRARTCTKELRLPRYETLEQLEERLACAMDSAGGLYDDDRMA